MIWLNHMKKNILIEILISAIILLSGFLIWQNKKSHSGTIVLDPQSLQQNQDDVAAANANMSTYTNKELGFSFDYSTSWGTPTIEKQNEEAGYIYFITFPNTSIQVCGASIGHIPSARDGGLCDTWTPGNIPNDVHPLQAVNTSGYFLDKFETMQSNIPDYYAYFKGNSKADNIAFIAPANVTTKDVFLSFAQSLKLIDTTPAIADTTEYFLIPEQHIEFKKVPGLTLGYTIDKNNEINFYSNEIKTAAESDPGISYCINNTFPLLMVTTIPRSSTEYQGYRQQYLNNGRYLNIVGQQAPCYTDKAQQKSIDLISQQSKLFTMFLESVQSY